MPKKLYFEPSSGNFYGARGKQYKPRQRFEYLVSYTDHHGIEHDEVVESSRPRAEAAKKRVLRRMTPKVRIRKHRVTR